VETVELV